MSRMALTLTSLLVCLLIGSIHPVQAAHDPVYGYHIIAYPGARSTTAYGINNKREIVGTYDFNPRGPVHAFLYRAGSYFNIDMPGAAWTYATGINDAGVIVGYYVPVDPQTCTFDCSAHAFIRENENNYRTIEPPNSTGSLAFAINSIGHVLGHYVAPGVPGGASFLFDKMNYSRISGAHFDQLRGLNSLGQFVGDGFVLDETGVRTAFGFPGAEFTRAFSINDSGQIAGFYAFPQENGVGVFRRGYIYSHGQFRTVTFPGAAHTELSGLNDHGEFVGSIQTEAGAFLAIVGSEIQP